MLPRFVVLGVVGLLAAQQATFQSTVRLVQTSVLVHDKSGQPVADLAAADFKIFEDGKEQKIQVFAVERGQPTAANAVAVKPPAGLISNQLAPGVANSVTVILFDRLNTEFSDQTSARDQILKMLARSRPGDHVALYVLESDEVRVLHDFTSDPERLVRILSRYVGAPSSDLAGSDTSIPDFPKIGLPAQDAETQAWLEHTMETISATYLRRRAQLSAAALEVIANHLAGIRGRKNLVWVSGAFPFVFKDELGQTVIVHEPVDRATRALNSANVAVYPVDARGLIGAFANPATVNAPFSGKRPPDQFTSMATTHPNQDTMRTVAEATGGRAYMNSNAIGEAVRRAMDDARVSYVLGYYPARTDLDGRFRQITVKVNRPGVEVRYRKGYLAQAPVARSGIKGRTQFLGKVMSSPLEATSIGLTAEITGDTLVVRVDASALTWTPRGEAREGVIDILIAQSTPDGTSYTIKETTVNLDADPERYEQLMKEGFTLTSKIALRPEAYRLHVVVSDVPSQAAGSLIIPAERVRNNR